MFCSTTNLKTYSNGKTRDAFGAATISANKHSHAPRKSWSESFFELESIS